MMVALDANFGLVHKRSAGKHAKPAKHGNRYFLPFEKVNEIVADSKNDKKSVNKVMFVHFSKFKLYSRCVGHSAIW